MKPKNPDYRVEASNIFTTRFYFSCSLLPRAGYSNARLYESLIVPAARASLLLPVLGAVQFILVVAIPIDNQQLNYLLASILCIGCSIAL